MTKRERRYLMKPQIIKCKSGGWLVDKGNVVASGESLAEALAVYKSMCNAIRVEEKRLASIKKARQLFAGI